MDKIKNLIILINHFNIFNSFKMSNSILQDLLKQILDLNYNIDFNFHKDNLKEYSNEIEIFLNSNFYDINRFLELYQELINQFNNEQSHYLKSNFIILLFRLSTCPISLIIMNENPIYLDYIIRQLNKFICKFEMFNMVEHLNLCNNYIKLLDKCYI